MMGEERRIACVFLPPLLYSLCKVASKLQTKNQQSEVHLETADNYSNTGSSTAYVYSSPWEMCVSHWTEPPGDPSIKGYLANFASKGGKSMDDTDNPVWREPTSWCNSYGKAYYAMLGQAWEEPMFKLLVRCKYEINRHKLLYLVFTALPDAISQRGS